MMEKGGKRIETLLPEAMIHHIQSFMTGKEAAQTTLLSKSWRDAWLTRPSLDFNQSDFKIHRHPLLFTQFTTNTIKRYKRLKLKIDSFTLKIGFQIQFSFWGIDHRLLATKLILDAMEIGATHLNIQLFSYARLPQQVLRSKTLVRLSVKSCQIDGTSINCPMLKSLNLEGVSLQNDDVIRDVIVSIEELWLSDSRNCHSGKPLALGWMSSYELRKLKRLYLEMVEVGNSFFDSFDSRFPCLKDLSLVRCNGYKDITISSTWLARISIVQLKKVLKAKFDVPNLESFSYSGKTIPSVAIKAAREYWECYISIQCDRPHTAVWYRKLNRLMIMLSSSRMNLSLKFGIGMSWRRIGDDVDEADDERVSKSHVVAVESLTIEAPFDLGWKLLVGMFWICSPKFVTHYWLPSVGCKYWMENNGSLKQVCDQLSQNVSSKENIIGGFGIKEVNVEVYEEINGREWRPLLVKKPIDIDALTAPPNKRKVRFGLKWW